MQAMVQFGRRVNTSIEGFGRFTRFCGSAFWWACFGANRWFKWNLLMTQFYTMGTRSAPVISLLTR